MLSTLIVAEQVHLHEDMQQCKQTTGLELGWLLRCFASNISDMFATLMHGGTFWLAEEPLVSYIQQSKCCASLVLIETERNLGQEGLSSIV